MADQRQVHRERLHSSESSPFYVKLPYAFIPFPAEYKYPYNERSIPRHNENEGVSGTLTYRITPCADLAIEVREREGGGFFLSGSAIRGRVRANAELLSNSYPGFVHRGALLYRDLAGDLKQAYRKKLEVDKGIEYSIRAGFLYREEQSYYIVPAQTFGPKYFISIKERRLLQLGGQLHQEFKKHGHALFDWDQNKEAAKQLDDLQEKVDDLTARMHSLREREDMREVLEQVQPVVSNLFTGKYNFNKLQIARNKEKVGQFFEELKRKLNYLLFKYKNNNKYNELEQLYLLTAERWRYKAEIEILYATELRKPKNSKFVPYQKPVHFKRTANHGIESISTGPTKDHTEKGYLFNSTNAGSKRSHYFVLGPSLSAPRYEVPESLVTAYNESLKKMRFSRAKGDMNERNVRKFYDLFNFLSEETGGGTGKNIVFFKVDDNRNLTAIGRTPYMKVPYETQLDRLLPTKPNDIDYANALFGFSADQDRQPDDKSEVTSYKSRLRFSPVDFIGNVPEWKEVDLLLPTPSASANAMYLKQGGANRALQTYESGQAELNGRKYYHILKNQVAVDAAAHGENATNLISRRKVIAYHTDDLDRNAALRGSIHFRNLSREEVGLLMLSLDCTVLGRSGQYETKMSEAGGTRDQTFELIGGAKPYGYGKVQMRVERLQLESKGNDFESLVIHPVQVEPDWGAYVDAFIECMGGRSYLASTSLQLYIRSKMEIDHSDGEGNGTAAEPLQVNWANLAEKIRSHHNQASKGEGYPKHWRLAGESNVK